MLNISYYIITYVFTNDYHLSHSRPVLIRSRELVYIHQLISIMIASSAPASATSLPEVKVFLDTFDFAKETNKVIGFQLLESSLVQFVISFGEGIFLEDLGLLRRNPFYSVAQYTQKVDQQGLRPIIAPPVAPPPLPGNSASGSTENHREAKAQYVLYCKLLVVLKQIFMLSAPNEIAFLKDPIFGFSNVTTNEMFAGIYAAHGTVTPAAKTELRANCKRSFAYGTTIQEALSERRHHIAMVRQMAPEYEPSAGDKLAELYDSVRAFHPKATEMIVDYDKITAVADRTFENLAGYLLMRELQLPHPLEWKARSAMSATTCEELPSACATTATTTITTERLQQLEETEKKFTKLRTASYCYSCGWGSHAGMKCNKMFNKTTQEIIAPYTQDNRKATKPAQGGSTRVHNGFRAPA